MHSPRTLALAAALVLSSSRARASDRFCVSDTGATTNGIDDRVWVVEDLNADGDFNDPGEVVAFYDENLGGVTYSNGNGIKVGPDGAVYLCDSTDDIVLRLRDTNSDGDANDAGEANVFYHSITNAQGIVMASALNLHVASNGVVWVASSGTSGGGVDMVLRLEDLNADGDADDAGESSIYYEPLPGAGTGESIPAAVTIGPDGRVYYVENGTSLVQTKGIYRLDDLNANGVIEAPGEVAAYFLPTAGANTAFHWCVQVDGAGHFYLNDTGNERIWKGRDLDASGSIDATTEASVLYAVGAASNIWELAFASDTTLFVAEDQTPDRLVHLSDLDANGTISGTGEVVEAYSDLVSATNIVSPRSIAAMRPGLTGAPFCFGDGVDPNVTTPCPCANFGSAGHGCANSAQASGARLVANGASNPDTVVLSGALMPAVVACIYLQGDVQDDLVFGDGVRCAGGSLIRLRTKTNVGGASQFPDSADTVTVSQRGMVTPGSGAVRFYQTYYRNAAATFCPPETFNVTNGFRITW